MPVTDFAPAQLPQHYQEDLNASNFPVYSYGGALYLFMVDGVGFGIFGGGTSQFFVYKSTNDGLTWTDVTPGAPTNIEGQSGQTFVRVGSVVYMPIGVATQFYKMYGFDLATESWIAAGPLTVNAIPNGLSAYQAVARGTDIVLLAGFGATNNPNLLVYDTAGAAWTLEPTPVAIDNANLVGGGLDTSGHVHFFVVAWSGANVGVGVATLQHFVVQPDNSVGVADTVYMFIHPPDQVGQPGDQVGQPVFYHDVNAGADVMTLPIATPAVDHRNVGLLLATAIQADVPAWSIVIVPTGEDFSTYALSNAGVSDNSPVASLLPVEFGAETQLHVFWTSNDLDFAPGNDPWNNYFRYIVYTGGVFSAVITLFSSLGTKITPGPVYPYLVSNNGSVAQVGGMIPTIDQALFFSLQTKYEALVNNWIAYAANGPILAAGRLPLPAPAGGMGRLFPSAEMRSRRICPPDPPFRKACKKAKEARYLLDDYPHVVAPPISEQVYVEQSVAAPANGLPMELLIYEVPEGYWFRLTGLIASFAGVSFVDGSGQTSWTLDVDSPTDVGGFVIQPVLPSGYVVPGFNNLRSHMGSFDFGCFQIGQPLIFHGLETVRLKVVTTAPFPGLGSGVIFNSAIQGYLWPAERN